MQITVLNSDQQATYDAFRSRLNDVIYFDRLLSEPVRKSIVDIDTGAVVLSSTTTKAFTNKYISARKLPTKEEKALSVEINHIMCTLCVYMIRRARPPVDIYTPAKIAELKDILEGLADYDDIECNLLLTFRDVVETAVKLFPNKDNKARVLFIGHRLGGSNLNMGKYSTGGGQSRPTERRVRIYEFESGTTPHRPSQEIILPRMIPNVIVPKSPPQGSANSVNVGFSHVSKRKRETRESIEVVAPVADAPEELLAQFYSLKRAAAEYAEGLARFVRQKGDAPRSDSASSSTSSSSYRPLLQAGKGRINPSFSTSQASVVSTTALASSFFSKYRAGTEAGAGAGAADFQSLVDPLSVPIVTPDTSEMLKSVATEDETAHEPPQQDDSLAFVTYPHVVPDFKELPEPPKGGGLDMLLSAFNFVQTREGVELT